MVLIGKEHDGNLVGPRFKQGGNVRVVVVDGDECRGRSRRRPRGAKILSFLILMAETSGDGFW